MPKILVDKEILEDLYTKQKLPIDTIGKLLGHCEETISKSIKAHKIPPNKRPNYSHDLAGQKFNRLTAIRLGSYENHLYRWECLCDCGKTKIVRSSELVTGQVPSCGCLKSEKHYRGKGDLSATFWNHVANQARRRKIEFTLDIDYAWNLFLDQNKLCALSGLPLVMARGYSKNPKIQTASLDRIDSRKGYIEGNVQWVHKYLNILKNSWDVDEFILMCTTVADYQRSLETYTPCNRNVSQFVLPNQKIAREALVCSLNEEVIQDNDNSCDGVVDDEQSNHCGVNSHVEKISLEECDFTTSQIDDSFANY